MCHKLSMGRDKQEINLQEAEKNKIHKHTKEDTLCPYIQSTCIQICPEFDPACIKKTSLIMTCASKTLLSDKTH